MKTKKVIFHIFIISNFLNTRYFKGFTTQAPVENPYLFFDVQRLFHQSEGTVLYIV